MLSSSPSGPTRPDQPEAGSDPPELLQQWRKLKILSSFPAKGTQEAEERVSDSGLPWSCRSDHSFYRSYVSVIIRSPDCPDLLSLITHVSTLTWLHCNPVAEAGGDHANERKNRFAAFFSSSSPSSSLCLPRVSDIMLPAKAIPTFFSGQSCHLHRFTFLTS